MRDLQIDFCLSAGLTPPLTLTKLTSVLLRDKTGWKLAAKYSQQVIYRKDKAISAFLSATSIPIATPALYALKLLK